MCYDLDSQKDFFISLRIFHFESFPVPFLVLPRVLLKSDV